MGRHERLHKLRAMLEGGGCFDLGRLQRELEASAATVKRDIAALRDEGAPIAHDPDRGGWYLKLVGRDGARYERLTAWSNPEEVHALLTMQRLLAAIDPGGLLGKAVEPVKARLSRLVARNVPEGVECRIRILGMAARPVALPQFKTLSTALLQRKRVHIVYHGRGRGEQTERTVSPQRLVHYRDNWHLDAWCHWRDGLRNFAVDAVVDARMVGEAAIDVDDVELDAVLGSGYGIFAGEKVRWARLRFTPERARWVAAEQWHPEQRSAFDDEGRYVLEVPYSDPTELVMDVLRYLPDVEVLGPAALDTEVRRRVREAGERWLV
jgi:predicted DNA-binding transcriptional regulator YafY